jgi:hypothetical protein
MASSTVRRPAIVAAGVAFLTSLVYPVGNVFPEYFRGPLVVFGAFPPALAHLLVFLIAPGLAVVLGRRLAGPIREAPLAAATGAGLAALLGVFVGVPVGWVLTNALVEGDLNTKAGFYHVLASLRTVAPRIWLTQLVPVAVATTVGLLAGGALAGFGDGQPTDDSWHAPALVAVGGFVGGFVIPGPFSAVRLGTVGPLSPTGTILLSGVVVPVAAGFLATRSSGGLSARRTGLLATVGVAATAIGAALGYGFVTSRFGFGEAATRYLNHAAPELFVDGLAAVTVLVLAVIAGMVLSRPDPAR